MRITVTLDDDLYRILKSQSRKLMLPFKQVINDCLRKQLLGGPSSKGAAKPFGVKPIRSGFRPGIDPMHLNRLLDELDIEDFIRESRADR